MWDAGRVLQLFEKPEESPSFIVAEIGINHLGNFDLALELIDAAAESGADAVKFQLFKTEGFLHAELLKEAFALFQSFEISYGDFSKLREYSERKGLFCFATPLDEESLEFLVESKVGLLKFASSDLFTQPFLKRAAESQVPTILSTGMAKSSDLDAVASFFYEDRLAFLYCVSEYPVLPKNLDLNVLNEMKRHFSGVIGFSDHSLETVFSVSAVAMGAKIIERHFTLNRKIEGADHAMSLSASAFSKMVKEIRLLEKALGSGEKGLTDFEKKIKPLSLRGIYATRELAEGQRVEKEDLCLLRPGNGVNADFYEELVGKRIPKGVTRNEEILRSG